MLGDQNSTVVTIKNLQAHTVYLIGDSPFQPWTSREQIVGPHKEVTRLAHVNAQSGVQHVPHTGRGLCVARCIVLVDTDCVPVSFFEIEDLILLSKLQMSAHGTSTPPEGVSASDQPTPGIILFSEEFHRH